MDSRRTVTIIWLVMVIWASPAVEASAQGSETLVIFDLACPDQELGQQLSDALRLKLGRWFNAGGAKWRVLSYLELSDQWQDRPVVPGHWSGEKVAGIVDGLASHAGLWGQVTRDGPTIRAKVNYLQLADGRKIQQTWTQSFTARGQRWKSDLSAQIGQAVYAQNSGFSMPPDFQTATAPTTAGNTAGRNILVNGGFERGTDHPVGWEGLDGLCTLWVPRPGGKGRCIKLNTNVLQSQAWQWWRRWRDGASVAHAPKPLPTSPPYYNTVAGIEGVHYYSDLIPITPGAIYRISCEQKAPPHSTSKVFIKGYAMLPPVGPGKPVHREVWRTYMQCRNSSGHWKKFSMDFQIPAKLKPAVRYTPQGKAGTYPVRLRWIKVILYAYWPVGQYYFDNVRLQRYSYNDLADKNGDKQVKPRNNNSHPANDRNKQ